MIAKSQSIIIPDRQALIRLALELESQEAFRYLLYSEHLPETECETLLFQCEYDVLKARDNLLALFFNRQEWQTLREKCLVQPWEIDYRQYLTNFKERMSCGC